MKTVSGWIGSIVLGLGLSVALAGCGERDQSLKNKTGQRGEKPWDGAKNAFVAKGWTVGNEESWRAQIRSRGQQQNEYVKTN